MMDAAHCEAARCGTVNDFPFSEINNPMMSNIFDKVSPLGNSLLHVAAASGNVEITQLMSLKLPFLITKTNSQSYTALHFAVKAGKLNTTKVLVDCARQISATSRTDGPTLLRIKNDEGNAALHLAILALEAAPKKSVDNLVALARYLVSEDPEVSYAQNKASKSPLCLAIESNNMDILEYILRALPQDPGLLDRLEGKNPVHVAIELKKLEFLRVIKEHKEELLLLVDDEENTPLHYAASVGYLNGVRKLLEIKSDLVFKRNKKGLYPIHLASENGHVKIMKELLEKWPDASEFLCNKGRSILHVAAMNGKEETVSYIQKEKAFDELVNKVDKDGNTPLHLATLMSCNPLVVYSLMRDKRSKLKLVNYQGLTAYDTFELNKYQKGQDSGNVEKRSTEVDLKRFEEPNGKKMMMTSALLYSKKERFYPKSDHSPTRSIKRNLRLSKEDINNRINNLFVVAALIVGSAYAGSLQLPFDAEKGGDEFGDHEDYWPKLLLGDFIFANVGAMNLSIAAAFTLCSALLLDDRLATTLVKLAFLLLMSALIFMASAFERAISTRMASLQIYRSSVFFMGFALRIFRLLLVCFILVILALGGEAFTQRIYLASFYIYFILHKLRRMICLPLLERLSSKSKTVVGFFIILGILFGVLLAG